MVGPVVSVPTDLEALRTELTGFCYRMLGSGAEAEDAVQETFLRAWQASGRYDERRGSVRTWVYRIATNHCLDLLRAAGRRALPMDLRPPDGGADPGDPAPAGHWVEPVPDHRVLPEDAVIARETIRLAFIAALQHLPPRQRAVLILRDVLCWRADEVAELLQTSRAAVTSALQRARETLRSVPPGTDAGPPPSGDLLERYCDAFERHDVPALVALLHEDATMTMPPFPWWVRGRERIRTALLDPQASCAGARLVPTAPANATAAFWQIRPAADGSWEPFGLVLLDTRDGLVEGITTFLDVDALLPLFGRPSGVTGGTDPARDSPMCSVSPAPGP
jgi:RNA polymerase sigma-70 factor, ECF subfamily